MTPLVSASSEPVRRPSGPRQGRLGAGARARAGRPGCRAASAASCSVSAWTTTEPFAPAHMGRLVEREARSPAGVVRDHEDTVLHAEHHALAVGSARARRDPRHPWAARATRRPGRTPSRARAARPRSSRACARRRRGPSAPPGRRSRRTERHARRDVARELVEQVLLERPRGASSRAAPWRPRSRRSREGSTACATVSMKPTICPMSRTPMPISPGRSTIAGASAPGCDRQVGVGQPVRIGVDAEVDGDAAVLDRRVQADALDRADPLDLPGAACPPAAAEERLHVHVRPARSRSSPTSSRLALVRVLVQPLVTVVTGERLVQQLPRAREDHVVTVDGELGAGLLVDLGPRLLALLRRLCLVEQVVELAPVRDPIAATKPFSSEPLEERGGAGGADHERVAEQRAPRPSGGSRPWPPWRGS